MNDVIVSCVGWSFFVPLASETEARPGEPLASNDSTRSKTKEGMNTFIEMCARDAHRLTRILLHLPRRSRRLRPRRQPWPRRRRRPARPAPAPPAPLGAALHLNLVTRLTLALGDETRLKTRLFTDETAQVEQLGATNLVDWKKRRRVSRRLAERGPRRGDPPTKLAPITANERHHRRARRIIE